MREEVETDTDLRFRCGQRRAGLFLALTRITADGFNTAPRERERDAVYLNVIRDERDTN